MIKQLTVALLGGLALAPAWAVAEVSSPRQIADRPAAHCQTPRWSPDGKQIAFDVYRPKKDERETWILKFEGDRKADEEEVTTGRAAAAAALGGGSKPPVVDFAWAHDMTALSKPFVFSSRGVRKNFDLFADGQWLTDKNPGNDGQPAWSPDGRFIAYTSQRADSGDIYVLDLANDSKNLQVTLWPNATEFRPVWAPGKSYLLFTRSHSGAKGQDIGMVVDVTRPNETTKMVTTWTGDEIRPSWAPDASRVAFYANKGNTNDKEFDLYVVGIDGQNAKRLAKDVVVDEVLGPAWSPDGSAVLFVKKDFKRDNPVMWARADGSASGVLDTGTQLNGDLALFGDATGRMRLAFKAQGQKGSTDKTWERLYLVTFGMEDLKPSAAGE